MEYINSLIETFFRTLAFFGDKFISIGKGRKIPAKQAKGAYFFQWHNDGWYHPDRIKLQMNGINESDKGGSMLSRVTFYDVEHQQAYFSFPRSSGNSAFCTKSVINEGCEYPQICKPENLKFVQALLSDEKMLIVGKAPHDVSVFHNRTSQWSYQFNNFFFLNQKLSQSASKLTKNIRGKEFSYEEGSDELLSAEFLNEIGFFCRSIVIQSN